MNSGAKSKKIGLEPDVFFLFDFLSRAELETAILIFVVERFTIGFLLGHYSIP